jgi:hypothetical protein
VPPEDGPAKTIYNRYTRWGQRIVAEIADRARFLAELRRAAQPKIAGAGETL